ncbi:MAG: M1 family aminopeptidase [Gemmatimonadota bacterium]|nr:M1 family aminopeptidase [Gemmatimonadota bacterium]
MMSSLHKHIRWLLVLTLPLSVMDGQASQVDGAELVNALDRVYDMLDDEKTAEVTLPEILGDGLRPVADRYPDTKIHIMTDMPVETTLATPDVNINVYFAGEESLTTELWKIYFERIDGRWEPVGFKALLSADIGDRFEPRKDMVYRFDEFRIQRDAMEMFVTDGYLVPGFAGDAVGRVIIFGNGRFTFTPANGVERQQMNKYARSESDTFSDTFSRLAILISPAGYHNLIKNTTLEPVDNGRIHNRARDLLKRIEKDYVMDVRPTEDKWSFLPTSPDYLRAEFDMSSSRNWLVYSYNPYEREQISLVQKTGFPRNARLKPPIMWCHFPAGPAAGSVNAESPPLIQVERYTIRGVLDGNRKKLRLKTTVDFTAAMDSVSVVTFVLNGNLNVRRVDYADGEAGLAIHQGTFLSVPLMQPLRKGERTSLTFQYDGDIRHGSTPFFKPQKNEQWLPMHSGQETFSFDLEIRNPDRLTAVTTGVKLSEREENGNVITTWSSPRRVNLVGLTFTDHRVITKQAGGVDLTIHANKDLLPSASRENEIIDLVDEALPFYTAMFGEYPYPKLEIIQIPDSYEFGQGLPSMLMLWGLYFRKDFILDRDLPASRYFNMQQFFRGFLAHELAHQWWGNVVIPRTYRDTWLSEGMATYAADLFIEQTDGREAFQEMLKNHMEQALNADKEGAISLGARLKGFYQPIVYEKSAMVLHMLRQVCGDEQFFTIVKRFYHDAYNRAVGTDDFRKVVEEVTRENMAWFFDQWIYDVGYPKYRLSYSSMKEPDGRFLVQGTLTQIQDGSIFSMPVPIRLELNNGEQIDKVIWNDSRTRTFEVIVTDDVRSIETAPDYAVYCETES